MLTHQTADWCDVATERIRADPLGIAQLFPVVRRLVGQAPVPERPGWTIDQAIREELLLALPLRGERLGQVIFDLYRYGDAAERIAVLKALPALAELGSHGLPVTHDAIRANDVRLIEAAMSEYAADYLDDAAYRQAVLKCAFTGVPLSRVAGLDRRADRELIRMLDNYARERMVAGRDVPADVSTILNRDIGEP